MKTFGFCLFLWLVVSLLVAAILGRVLSRLNKEDLP